MTFQEWCEQNDRLDLLEQWHPTKNGDIASFQIYPKSNKKVWWLGKCGHEWQTSPNNRQRGTGCPYCSNQKILQGYNDLETWCISNNRQDLIDQWSLKNQNSMSSYSPHSGQNVWWKCPYGHEWFARINHRVSSKSNCPICNSKHTSLPEQAVLYYVSIYYPDTINAYTGFGFEIDIYVPSKNTAIEYDGKKWHENKHDKELEKIPK